MEIVVELDLRLSTIVETGVMIRDKTNSCCAPLRFRPLMIRDVELVVFHDTTYGRNSFDVADGFVGENPMKNVISCATSIIFSHGLLVEFKLFLMDSLIIPLQSTDRFNWLVVVVENDNISAESFLNGLNPMGMDDAWGDLMMGGSGVNETEL